MSDDNQLPPLPPAPDPTTIAQWTGQIRTVLALLGGVGIGGAWLQHITNAEISNYLTSILTIFGLAAWAVSAAWSWWQKRKAKVAARQAVVAAAVASAEIGEPVTVIETPKGQPNLVVRIAPAEALAAPTASVVLPG